MRNFQAQQIIAFCLVFLCIAGVVIVSIVFGKSEQTQNATEPIHREKARGHKNQKSDDSMIPDTKHLQTPDIVKALYMSNWVAGTQDMRDDVLSIVDTTSINAVVIDIKDATGKVGFATNDELIKSLGSEERRIRDIIPLIEDLHSKNVYVIGRISVFQDAYLTAKKPEWALKRISNGAVWKDKKGLSFLNPLSPEVLEYIEHIAIASYDIGFDEINFDYIRFPSDGDISDIVYPTSEGKTRSDAIRDFWQNLHTNLRAKRPHMVMSGDLFGLTTSQTDDMGIGQILENAFPYFDYIAPMIYPSHYPPGWNNFKNPAEHPYEVVHQAMSDGIERAQAAGYPASKFRPWIQDFNLGATYTKGMIQAQIRALNDLGIESFMVWDPKNSYTASAYE